jgi:hypothetical protein
MQKKDTVTENEIIINKISQDKIGFDDGLAWFDKLDLVNQKEIIQKLIYFIQQSHPDKESIDLGLEIAPIKKTMTPVILLKTQEHYNLALNKIADLPDSEIRKSFIVLISVFKIADKRRGDIWCKNGCTHDWHNIE